MSGECLHEIVALQARRYPYRPAVTHGTTTITYAELDAAAERVAARLRAEGVRRDTLVGVCIDRSTDLIVGILGVLKAGGAYVPIDPAYPAPRIDFLVRDSGVGVVVTTSRNRARLPGGVTGLEIDGDDGGAAPPESPGATTDASGLAYVIYTSGSTGRPKGVLVEHRQAVRLFTSTQPWFGFGPDDVWTMFHTASFDFSVWEIFGALLYGGRLVIVPVMVTRLPGALAALLSTEKVTVLSQTPTAFRQLVGHLTEQDRDASALRYVILGGERLEPGTLVPWLRRYGDASPRIVNMYGITETTVHVTYRPISAADVERPSLSPIGVPIPDLDVVLVDSDGVPVSDGTPGEILVGGAGVARGYHDRPELDAARFPRRPDGSRVYRSGDRGVRLDGELFYLGRIDDQLKVRGFRIEPAEIELCLTRALPGSQVVIVPRDFGGGDLRLVAFVVPPAPVAGHPLTTVDQTEQLSRTAAAELPPHLRPATYHVVKELPMTIQGKVDRKTLAATGTEQNVEAEIVQIIEQVLERTDIKPDVDVFDIGATSLAYIRIVAAVNERYGLSLNGSEVGDTSSAARLAECVTAARDNRVPTTA